MVRGVVAAAPRPVHPARHHLPRRPRARPRPRSAATPSAGFVAVTLPERPHKIGFPSIFDDAWDPVIRACAETDTVICLHVGSSGMADVAPGAPLGPIGATLFGQLALTVVRRVGVVGLAGAIPGPEDRDVGGRARLGRDAARPPRLHRRPLRATCRTGSAPTAARPTCCGATSGSARSTTRRRSTPATASASSTSCSRSTTRTATARGPTRRPSSSSYWGHIPDDELRLMTHANAAAAFRHPLPPVTRP